MKGFIYFTLGVLEGGVVLQIDHGGEEARVVALLLWRCVNLLINASSTCLLLCVGGCPCCLSAFLVGACSWKDVSSRCQSMSTGRNDVYEMSKFRFWRWYGVGGYLHLMLHFKHCLVRAWNHYRSIYLPIDSVFYLLVSFHLVTE